MRLFKRDSDTQFTRLAIKYVLGVVLGFSLFSFGIIFLFISILSFKANISDVNPIKWLIYSITFIIIGIALLYLELKPDKVPYQQLIQ